MTALIMPRSVRTVAPALRRGVRSVSGRAASVLPRAAASGPTTAAPVRAATGRTAAPRRMRLTRRGRLVLVGLPFVTGAAALLVVAAVFLLPATVKASTDSVPEPVTQSVTVQAGQGLWDVALAADPERDTREVMGDIAELNGLTSPGLRAGQVLEVPAR
ncbi:LysM peptidoglycan-binding domain-containing protein [Kocuria sp.]|uniref:LysM peptidoglycan-binding domain-containing protein n=1 Tax=Kocuria sp. TaxID=1871328 RepID=UPI0026DC9222|nr:LysM peptidoglycan-binding domain-containing protein [Kocuria sp.]MDO4919534.1 LysM peptidoglycan-binding domain-containing protein [Kocuria sp.]